MLDNPELFWKNFRLGTELQIAGSFIYNALYSFENMDHFFYVHECFEFLYNTSVGLERLEKIALILLSHDNVVDQNEFEKSLITHSHLELIGRIKKFKELKIGKLHNKFLQLLTNFYNSTRYDRYNLSSAFHANQDQKLLVEFIEDGLQIKIEYNSFFPSAIDSRIKSFMGKIISKIATSIYDLINERAHELNIYTYEIVYSSKAYKIFIDREYSFQTEKLFQKEILISLMNSKRDNGFFKFIKAIDALDFDMPDPNEYIKFMMNIHKNRELLSEIVYLYEENDFDKNRLSDVDAIGSDATFDYDEEFE